MGLFHVAMERGKLNMLNPMNIPVYEWVDGVAVRRPLDQLYAYAAADLLPAAVSAKSRCGTCATSRSTTPG